MRHGITLAIVILAGLTTLGFLAALLYPGCMLVWASLADETGRATAQWWRELFEFRFLLATPLLHSLALGIGTASSACLLAVPLAWLVMRSDLPGRNAILPLVALPHIVPGFQLASAWVLIFTRNGMWHALFGTAAPLPAYGGIAIWVVLTLHLYVFVFMIASSGMAALDASLEEAGRASGMSPWRVFRRVTLPLMVPAILSGTLLCFAYAIEEFGVPSLLGTPTGFVTLTTAVYEQATTPPISLATASAQSLVLAVIAVMMLTAGIWLGKRRQGAMLSGKGQRRPRVALGHWRWPLGLLVWAFLLVSGLAPLAALGVTSLLKSWGMGYGVENWTLARHLSLLATPDLARAAVNTLAIAGLSALLATLVGIAVAYGTQRLNARWAKLADHLSFVSFATPGLVIGVALMLAFGSGVLNLYGTYAILVVAYMVRFSGIAVRSAAAGFQQIGADLENAGRAVGIPFVRVLARIALPLARRGIIAGLLLAFINGVKEISCTSLLVSQGRETLAYEAYLRFQEGNYTQGSVVSLWMIALSLIVMACVAWLGRGQTRGTAI